jgi:superfamily II DNA or RNA helicase
MSLFNDLSIEATFDDKRTIGAALPEMDLTIEFRQEQKTAIEEINKFDTGILHAPTAFGKTVTAIGMINKRKCNTLILVHSRQLLDQWKERLKNFMPDIEVGVFGAGKKKPTRVVDVATYQSLVDRSSGHVNTVVHDYGHVIIDECHHLSAPKYELVLNEVRAKYVLGLTATPERQDGHQKITFMSAGPIRYKAKIAANKFIQKVVAHQRYDSPPNDFIATELRPKITDIYQWLSDNDDRNKSIIQKVVQSVADGGHPILLTERRSHAELLSEMLEKEQIKVVTLRGGMGVKQRRQLNDVLPSAQVIVATGKYIGEGFDLPKLDTLFLAMPIAWKGSLAQYAGRIQRQAQNKTEIIIHDFIDCNIPMLDRMFKKRERSYTALGYSIEFSGTQSSII